LAYVYRIDKRRHGDKEKAVMESPMKLL